MLEGSRPPTLTEAEETRRENGRTEEPQEDGAADELKACVLSLCTKPLPDAVQCELQIPRNGNTN